MTPDRTPGELEKWVLHGLQHKPVYQGTVPRATIAERREHNRLARRARRLNRRT